MLLVGPDDVKPAVLCTSIKIKLRPVVNYQRISIQWIWARTVRRQSGDEFVRVVFRHKLSASLLKFLSVSECQTLTISGR